MITADWVVVGAGFTGATFAERMASAGHRVLLIERRGHIGGNAYDEHDEHGVLVHRYGPHIFHTNSSIVWKYLSRFTDWRPYSHEVLGLIEGQLVPIPFNFNSIDALFPADIATRIETRLLAEYGEGRKVPILKLRESTHTEIHDFADFVYKNVFEGYTLKQWRLRPEQLSPSVTARVPIYVGRDNRYFQDTYQAMPLEGYTAMFGRMLGHPNITTILNCEWADILTTVSAKRVLYTGALDELLGYRFGPLPYRSLRFVEETHHVSQRQRVGTVNYPNDFDYTRTTEMKFLTGQQTPFTTIFTEYPQDHEPGRTTAYYPIPRDENQILYKRYLKAARATFPTFCFGGRLGDYQYYNMDQACAGALKLASDLGA